MQTEGGVYLKPTPKRKRVAIYFAIFIFLFALIILIAILREVGIFPGRRFSYIVLGPLIFVFIMFILGGLSMLLDGFFRKEIVITNEKIVRPGKEYNLMPGLNIKQVFFYERIKAIYLHSDFIKIKCDGFKREATIGVEPDGFLKVIEEKFPHYKIKIRKEG